MENKMNKQDITKAQTGVKAGRGRFVRGVVAATKVKPYNLSFATANLQQFACKNCG